MADTSDNLRSFVLAAGQLLTEEKAQNVRVLKVTDICSWADYLVLGTAQSQRQLQGLVAEMEELTNEADKKRLNNRPASDAEWALLDLGDTVIHLFTKTARDFYDLDRLFHDAEILFSSPD